jgi:glycosyltransferase involved in cell wall biosynthesis
MTGVAQAKAVDLPIVFLGAVYLPGQKLVIAENAIGTLHNSADVFQKALLGCLSLTFDGDLFLVNLPFVGSWPRRFRRPYFPAAGEEMLGRVKARGHGFLNVTIIKFPARLVSAWNALRRTTRGRPAMLVVYSTNLSFLGAALLHRFRYRNAKICLVISDLPDFTSSMLKHVESAIVYRLVRRVDCFVLVARAMADRLGVDENRCIVIEGISDEAGFRVVEPDVPDDGGRRIFLFAGSLAARHGIADLLAAFARIDAPEARLWVCGSGDMAAAVAELAQRDPRVRMFGQIPHAEVLGLQRRAHVMVNPRLPFDDFTRYSFPHKTMEYLASGRPVVMHRLPGIPDEYIPHLVIPPTPDVAGLSTAMERLIAMPDEELKEIGEAGRVFVTTEKAAAPQGRRLVQFLRRMAGGTGQS